ncbi:MAG TPA: hypothetical protein VNA28_02055 [Solirubrobacteraceae bacterium]|nr:hypothetical protein [Solirubrobacteraceae bacterium]
MRDHDETTRYALELDMLERNDTRGNAAAIELLRSEFALALNASYFMALTGGDIEVGAIWRSRPQEGVVRYAVEILLEERVPSMSDEQVAELLRREFARAQNASHFVRIASDDFSPRLVARASAHTTHTHPRASLRAA